MNSMIQFFNNIEKLGVKRITSGSGTGIRYLAIPNIDNAKWLVPLGDYIQKRCALLIYQPINLKGKIFKTLIPFCPNGIIEKLLKRNLLNLTFEDNGLFNANKNYTFFLGSEGVHKKVTIQMSKDQNIDLYIKISQKPEIIDMFDNERKIIEYLRNFEIAKNVPEIALYKNYNGIGLIAFSTTKNLRSIYQKSLNDLHVGFLLKLYRCGSKKVFNRESEYYKKLESQLKEYIARYPSENWISDAFRIACDKILKQKINLIPIHHDFTFWNTYFNGDEIFVFDWEYATLEGLPFYDILHFIIQPLILNNEDRNKIIECIKKNTYLLNYAYSIGISKDNIKPFILLHLIDIILLYEFRSHNTDANDQKLNDNRKELLKFLWCQND